ncbi:MAG: hypothetical protein ACKOFW_09165, partial [Planctomycetaceae bacterium]
MKYSSAAPRGIPPRGKQVGTAIRVAPATGCGPLVATGLVATDWVRGSAARVGPPVHRPACVEAALPARQQTPARRGFT